MARPPRESRVTWKDAVDPAEAERTARVIRDSKVGRLTRALRLELSPLSAAVTLDAFWAKQVEGREAEGKELLRQARERGVPLPFEP